MSEMTSGLVERIEAATEPDRELDAIIWLHLPEQESHAWKHGGNRFKHAAKITGAGWIPLYTHSVDAAMTLIRRPWLLGTLSDHGKGRWGACLTVPMKWDCGTMANGPALAICAAALRAPLPAPPAKDTI